MSLIFLAAVIFNLAFSANVTNVRKLLAEEEVDNRGWVTSGSCKGHCDKLRYCGMPTELAQLFLQGEKEQPQQQMPRMPYFPGMMRMPGPYFPGMMGMPFPYYGEQQDEGGNRRLLAQPVCKDKPAQFLLACGNPNIKHCRGALTCPQIAQKGLCVVPALAAKCCKSCHACKDLSPNYGSKWEHPSSGTPCSGAIKGGQCGCKGIKRQVDMPFGYPTFGCNAPDGKKWCARTCDDSYPGNNDCDTALPDACLDATDALLKQECDKPEYQKCGISTDVKTCVEARKEGFCRLPWVSKNCRKTCKACVTCASTPGICPDGFTLKYSQRKSTKVTVNNCCIDTDKVCSCEWECMFSDSCCSDFSDRCCK